MEVSADASNALSRSEFYYDDVNLTGNLTEERVWNSTEGACRARSRRPTPTRPCVSTTATATSN